MLGGGKYNQGKQTQKRRKWDDIIYIRVRSENVGINDIWVKNWYLTQNGNMFVCEINTPDSINPYCKGSWVSASLLWLEFKR